MPSFSCQICGVDMAIARIRAAHEPPDAAWEMNGANYVGFSKYGSELEEQDQDCQDCTTADRNQIHAEALRTNWSDDEHESDGEWLPEGSDTDSEPLEYCSESEDNEDDDHDSVGGSSFRRSSGHNEDSNDVKTKELYPLSGLCTPSPERFPHGTWRFGKWYSTGGRFGPFLNDILPHDEATVPPEHVAAPSCQSLQGINGNALTVEQMKNCRNVRYLMPKMRKYWQPEEWDRILEEESLFYITGESNGSNLNNGRDHISWRSLHPWRHDLDNIIGSWYKIDEPCHDSDDDDDDDDDYDGYDGEFFPLPMHSYCLDLYAKASFRKHSRVDLDGLWLWRQFRKHPGKFEVDESVNDRLEVIERARRDWDTPWLHVPGDEWLAANPVEVPGLSRIMDPTAHDPKPDHQDQFDRGLLSLPTELLQDIISRLDVASLDVLALTCRTLYSLTQLAFRGAIFMGMPWLWEILEDVAYPESPDWPITWDPRCPPGLKSPKADPWLHEAWQERDLWEAIASEYPEMADVAKTLKTLNDQRREEIRMTHNAKRSAAVGEWNDFRKRVEHWILQARGATTYPNLDERNWRRLYWICSPTTTKVPGLRNRARIWEQCEKILKHVSEVKQSTEFLRRCELVQAKKLDLAYSDWERDMFQEEGW